MAYLLDGAVILIFILFVWVGSRRGLVRSVLRLISCVVSLVLALLLSTVAAGGLFDAFLSESAQEIIAQHLPETDAASVASGVEEALHQLPGFVESALTAGGLGSPEEIASSVQDVLGQSPETVAQAITEQVIRPAAVALMGSVCFLLLFLLFMILFGILIGLINRVFQLPVLKQLNGALGAVVGAAEGVLVIFAAVTVLQIVVPPAGSDAPLTAKEVNDTVIVRAIGQLTPSADTLEHLQGGSYK